MTTGDEIYSKPLDKPLEKQIASQIYFHKNVQERNSHRVAQEREEKAFSMRNCD